MRKFADKACTECKGAGRIKECETCGAKRCPHYMKQTKTGFVCGRDHNMKQSFKDLKKSLAEVDNPSQLELDLLRKNLHESDERTLPERVTQHVASHPEGAHAEIHYTSKGSGEEAIHKIRLGVDVEDLYRQDVHHLNKLIPTLSGVHHKAATELLTSRMTSLLHGPGNNPDHTTKDAFESVAPGLKRHKETGELHIHGVSVEKHVLKPGVHKEVNSSEKTIAKNTIAHSLPSGSGKYRQFGVSAAHSVKLV